MAGLVGVVDSSDLMLQGAVCSTLPVMLPGGAGRGLEGDGGLSMTGENGAVILGGGVQWSHHLDVIVH